MTEFRADWIDAYFLSWCYANNDLIVGHNSLVSIPSIKDIHNCFVKAAASPKACQILFYSLKKAI